jgi:hypothetical protein
MSWMMRQSCRASPGHSTALLTLMMRPSTCVLFVQAAGQHDVGVPRRIVEEEVDRHEELELVETTRDEVIVG